MSRDHLEGLYSLKVFCRDHCFAAINLQGLRIHNTVFTTLPQRNPDLSESS